MDVNHLENEVASSEFNSNDVDKTMVFAHMGASE